MCKQLTCDAIVFIIVFFFAIIIHLVFISDGYLVFTRDGYFLQYNQSFNEYSFSDLFLLEI